MSAGVGTSVQEANKALARYWFEEGWTRGNLAVADQVFAPGFLLGGKRVGPDGPRASVRRRHAAFADLTVGVGLQVAEGPWVATWFSTRARHVGEFAGIAPTGRWVTSEGVQLWRVEDGLVAEDHNVFDRGNVLAQLRTRHGNSGDDNVRKGPG